MKIVRVIDSVNLTLSFPDTMSHYRVTIPASKGIILHTQKGWRGEARNLLMS